MKKTLQEVLTERRLVCDGAMGTQLMLAGLEQGGCGELWNLGEPSRVLAIQRRYVEAGADAIFPEALQSADEFRGFAKEVQAPLLANMTEFGKSPLLSFFFEDQYGSTCVKDSEECAESYLQCFSNTGLGMYLSEKPRDNRGLCSQLAFLFS